jgi:hypothetical protein
MFETHTSISERNLHLSKNECGLLRFDKSKSQTPPFVVALAAAHQDLTSDEARVSNG